MTWLKTLFVREAPAPKVYRQGRLMPAATAQIPEAALFDPAAVHEACEVLVPCDKPRPCQARYVIVECGRDCEGKLQEHWLSGEPVEISGVLFEFAVVARRRTWRAPMLVRGVVVG